MLSGLNLKQIWYDFVSCGHFFRPQDASYRRVYLINAMMFLAALVFCFFGLFNLLVSGLYTIAAMDFICLILTIFLLYDLRYHRSVQRSALLAIALILGGLIAYVVLSHGQSYGLIWMATLPPFAFFLLGLKRGLVLVLGGWVVLLLAMVIFGSQWPDWSFDTVSVANVAVALLALIGLIAYYEYTRNEAATQLAVLNRTLQERIDRALAENLSQQKLLIQRSKMADLGEAFGMLAHQWKQPLTVCTLAADVLNTRLEELGGEGGRESPRYYTRTLQEQLEFMRQSVDDFQAFMHPSRNCAPFKPYGAFLKVVKLYGPVLKKREIDLEITANEAAQAAQIEGYANELMQAGLNLLSNACDAILKRRAHEPAHTGQIALQMERRSDQLMIAIEDNGSGVNAAIAPKLFELFVTDKGPSGNGLGLYMSRVIIERMGGTIALENHEDGAVVTICLPIAPALG
jgi:signal transduction histidine kinase